MMHGHCVECDHPVSSNSATTIRCGVCGAIVRISTDGGTVIVTREDQDV